MSYSFSVQAKTKAEAVELAEKAFDSMVESQPVHARDKAAALANLAASPAVLPDEVPEGQVFRVGLNGYLSWAYKPGETNDNPSTQDINAVSVSSRITIGQPY